MLWKNVPSPNSVNVNQHCHYLLVKYKYEYTLQYYRDVCPCDRIPIAVWMWYTFIIKHFHVSLVIVGIDENIEWMLLILG